MKTWLRRMLLKKYLHWQERLDRRVRDRLAMSLFVGMHPKNVFNYRYEFFRDNVTSKDVVLDIGCGTGFILHRIADVIERGYGLDREDNNREYFDRLSSRNNLEYISGDILHFDFSAFQRRTQYNVCIASHVLEHVQDVPALLKRIDAQRLLICVPSQENWQARLNEHLDLSILSDEGHFREYTRPMLAAELASAGYRIVFMGFNPEGEIICRAET